MRAQNDWYKARKNLLKQVKEQVSLRLGEEDLSLKEYYKHYQNEFKGNWRSSSYKELFGDLFRVQVILGGDFHAYAQSQRVHLRILREIPKEKKWALALECFEAKDQHFVDLYLQKKIKEKEFLKKIQWDERWGFAWSHYRPLVRLAMSRGIPVLAINKHYKKRSQEILEKRDIFSAKTLAQHQKREGYDFIYVIYGDLHLSRPHLPEKIKTFLKIKEKQLLCIFQNSERLYFQLARNGQEHQIEVLKSSRNRYCIIASPPWVKWQSYLLYLDRHFEFDSDEEDEGSDYTDAVKNQLTFLLEELELKLPLNDIEVYSPEDTHFWKKLMGQLSAGEKKNFNYLIKNSRSFYLAAQGVFCLSQNTMNQMSEMAGHYIQAKLTQRKKNIWKMPQQFTQLIWIEAIGFFMSKIVNHKRKSETLKSLKARLSVSHPKDQGRKALLLALDQRLCEILSFQGDEIFPRKFNPKDPEIYYEAGRILGHMLGDKIFLAYRMERFSKQDIIKIIKTPINTKSFSKTYAQTVAKVENMDSPLSLGGLIYG